MRLLTFLLLFTLLGCGNNPDATATDAENTTAAAPSAAAYPPLPLERLEYLWENCDYIDFVFYTFDFSMNQHEQSGIRATLAGIAETAPQINSACRPVGRAFFQVEGEVKLEADIYLDQGCIYYLFMENGQPVYANEMTEQGLGFYINIFQQADQMGAGNQ